MRSDLIELEVCVHGKPCREYPHQGKHWIEGRKGSPYTLRLKNRTWNRVLVSLSVDGLSVMTGKAASKSDGGYILGGHESLNLPGWFLNDKEVAKFVFSRDKQSYAAKMGQDVNNLGVIGCAVFKELVQAIYSNHTGMLRGCGGQSVNSGSKKSVRHESQMNHSFAPSSTVSYSSTGGAQLDSMPEISCNVSQEAAPVEQEMGTGFGKSQEFVTRTTTFNKESERPNEVLQVHYDGRNNLKKRGIDLDRKPVVAEPNPFPADSGCQPPPDWRG